MWTFEAVQSCRCSARTREIANMNRRDFLRGATAVGIGVAVAPLAFAQSFPSRLVRIVAPTGPGSPPDIMARIVAGGLSDGEAWKVIVEDKPGAATTIGAAEVLKQPADGHTLFVAMPPITAAPGLVPNLRFKMESDFAPVIQIGTGYNILVVNPKVPAHSVSELVEFSRGSQASIRFPPAASARPPTFLASYSSWKPAYRRRMCPTPTPCHGRSETC
jgi:tripartite-type tricarboxylate transporter receptor subunit TctC